MPDTKKKLVSLKPKNHGGKSEKSDDENLQESVDVETPVNELDNVEQVDDLDEDFDEPDDEDEEKPSGVVLEGRVKWFNDRRGYGYITCITEGEFHNNDIFVHHTNVRPLESKYRSLYTNEYVQFYLGQADVAYDDNDNPVVTDYKHQATHVTGIAGGPLLCDGSYRPNTSNQRRTPNSGGGRNTFSGGSNRNNRDEEYDEPPRQRQPLRTRNHLNTESNKSRPVRRAH
jgi:cold shock CspA family protein